MQLSLLDSWKLLPIDKYDGTTDPDEHLDVFLTQVTLSTTDDAALCHIFPTSLKGRALSWFTLLPPNSIDSFNMLSAQFTIQFATSRPHSLTSLSLVSLRQDKKESLRTFMDRFNKAALEIRDLTPAVALHHLTTALKPGPFGIDPEPDDPMVISIEIHNCIVKKTLIDQGSSADILYWNTFKQLGISEKELIPYDDPLVGFSGERVSTKGYINLFTRFCFDEQESREIQVKYIVVHASTSYNILLGRPSLNMLGAIVSTPHLAMKFPSDKGKIITIHADQKAARECYFASF
uniref:Retrotransposon gag domain-containing protein n=1 Tax=Cajanus cajan TaxID=3821 RepID=A0A151RFV2_CAJCA|nr:hypothetical protein KK1_037196 [Cajanus cajan]